MATKGLNSSLPLSTLCTAHGPRGLHLTARDRGTRGLEDINPSPRADAEAEPGIPDVGREGKEQGSPPGGCTAMQPGPSHGAPRSPGDHQSCPRMVQTAPPPTLHTQAGSVPGEGPGGRELEPRAPHKGPLDSHPSEAVLEPAHDGLQGLGLWCPV